MCIYSDAWEDHLVHLDTVLSHRYSAYTKLEEAGLTIKPSKSTVAYNEAGHTVGNNQIKPMIRKKEAVMNFLHQTTRRML